MSAFFVTTNRRKCIAVSTVAHASIRHTESKFGPSSHWALFDANGTHLGDTYQDPTEMGTVIPGNGEALVVSIRDDIRPTADDVWVHRQPVVGWTISGRDAEPILPETRAVGDRIMFVTSDGGVLDPHIAHYDNLDAMKASVLIEAQAEWDRRHQVSPAVVP